jgi:hypothetical protein
VIRTMSKSSIGAGRSVKLACVMLGSSVALPQHIADFDTALASSQGLFKVRQGGRSPLE